MNPLRMSAVIVHFLVFLVVSESSPTRADDAQIPAALQTLETAVQNMGYDIQPSGQSFSIPIRAKYSYTLQFSTSKDQSAAYVLIACATLSADDLKKLNTMGLLVANDVGAQYFSLHDTGQNTSILYLQSTFLMAGLSAANLRRAIDNLTSQADATDTLWNTALWK